LLYSVHFLCLPKENEPKERAALFTWSAYGGLSCAALKKRALRNSLRSNSPRAFPFFYVLLGCVKWRKKTLKELTK